MKQPQRVYYKAMKKKLYLSNKSLKLDILKWIAILGIKRLKGAAKNKNCVAIPDRDRLNLKPGCHGGS